MSLVPTLRKAALIFRAGFLDIPLDPIVGPGRKETSDLVAPKIRAPEIHLQIEPVRALALRELIRQADSGTVEVSIPLPKRTLSIGPLTIDLTGGHAAVIELEVDTARVLRKKTKGRVEPPINLPLGMRFVGLYLNEHGEVIADISSFPDINLNRWSAQVPQIPSTLDRVLDLIFPDDEEKPAEEAASEEPEAEPEEKLDLSELKVSARDVRPRGVEPLDLGKMGVVMLGPNTRLDVDYSSTELLIRGRAHVKHAIIEGRGFRFEGISAEAEVAWRLFGDSGAKEMTLSLTGASARVERATVTTSDLQLEFGEATFNDFELAFRTGDPDELSIRAGHVAGSLTAGGFGFQIGDHRVEAKLKPFRTTGTLAFEQQVLAFDATVDGAGITVPHAQLDLGVMELDVTGVSALASGQVRGSTRGEVTFSGALDATADVASSQMQLGKLGATLAEGSKGTIRVTELEADRGGLKALIGSAALDLQLHSGSIPLGPTSKVEFSQGASGTLKLDTVALAANQRWPYLEGTLKIDAGSDPVAIDDLLEIPRGQGQVVGQLTLDPSGHLSFSNLELNLSAE